MAIRHRKPTERQLEVYRFICEFVEENKRPPTQKEIADNFLFRINAARDHLLALERKGLLILDKPVDPNRFNYARNIKLTCNANHN